MHLWRAAHERLPKCCKARPPNLCVLQTYRRSKRDFMDYHTDSRAVQFGNDDNIVQVRRATARLASSRMHRRMHRSRLAASGPRQRRHHVHDRQLVDEVLLPPVRPEQREEDAVLVPTARGRGARVGGGARAHSAPTSTPPATTPHTSMPRRRTTTSPRSTECGGSTVLRRTRSDTSSCATPPRTNAACDARPTSTPHRWLAGLPLVTG